VGASGAACDLDVVVVASEQAVSTELGLELAFLKNRLRFDGTIYRSDNKNQVLSISTPTSDGYSGRQINAGLVRSQGIELQVGGTIIQSKDWTWNLSVNYTKNNSYIMSLVSGVPYYSFWQDGNSGSWTYAKGQAIPNAFDAKGNPVISDGKIGQLWDNQVATVTGLSVSNGVAVCADSGTVVDRLLLAAGQLLHEAKGGNVSTRAICDRAGVQAPTLYHHFGSKQGLLDAVVKF